MFWFGGPLPEPHKVCLRTWVQQGYVPQLWRYEPLDEIEGVVQRYADQVVPKVLAERWLKLPDGHAKQTFANFFRYALMARVRHGWWADTDFICVQRLPDCQTCFTHIPDIKTRPELLTRWPTLPKVGGNIANGLFRVNPMDEEWLVQLTLDLWPSVLDTMITPFGTSGTIAFTSAVKKAYDQPPIQKLIGNDWADRYRIFEDPAWLPPDFACVLHLYNYTNPPITSAQRDTCWDRATRRLQEIVRPDC